MLSGPEFRANSLQADAPLELRSLPAPPEAPVSPTRTSNSPSFPLPLSLPPPSFLLLSPGCQRRLLSSVFLFSRKSVPKRWLL